MGKSEAISKLGTYSLPAQCVFLCFALLAFMFKLGPTSGWLLIASLTAGLLAFLSGVAASIVGRRARWLGLSAAAVFVSFFSMLAVVALGGGAGV
jgi:hypothetical protein